MPLEQGAIIYVPVHFGMRLALWDLQRFVHAFHGAYGQPVEAQRYACFAPLPRDLLSTFGRTLGSHLRSLSFVVQLQREAERLATEEGNAAVGAKAQWLAQVLICCGALQSRF